MYNTRVSTTNQTIAAALAVIVLSKGIGLDDIHTRLGNCGFAQVKYADYVAKQRMNGKQVNSTHVRDLVAYLIYCELIPKGYVRSYGGSFVLTDKGRRYFLALCEDIGFFCENFGIGKTAVYVDITIERSLIDRSPATEKLICDALIALYA